jgi:hypothetical protein
MKTLMYAAALLALGACSWVKPTSQSHEVVLANQDQVVNCVKKGSTTSKTLSKITVVPRSNDKIFSELVMLAKNEAAILGGDTVVAEGIMEAGSQRFGVYRCR